MDGIGKPRSYGKFEIFDDEQDELSWDAAEKRAHESLRKMGLPVAANDNVAIIPPREARPFHQELEKEKHAEEKKPVRHKRAGEEDLPPPRTALAPSDKKLEAIAKAHILLHWIKANLKTLCDNEPQVIGWIDEILDTAPKK